MGYIQNTSNQQVERIKLLLNTKGIHVTHIERLEQDTKADGEDDDDNGELSDTASFIATQTNGLELAISLDKYGYWLTTEDGENHHMGSRFNEQHRLKHT